MNSFRLDIGEGNYIKELEEDYEISDQISELQEFVMNNESTCEAFKGQFIHYSYLWTQDLNQTLQVLCSVERTLTYFRCRNS